MDILTRLFDSYVEWTAGLSVSTCFYLFRADLLLVLPSAVCAYMLYLGIQSTFVQSVCLIIAIFISFLVPCAIPQAELVLALFFSLSIVALLFLPGILSFLITPVYVIQKRISFCIYVLLVFLACMNYLQAEGIL